MVAPESSDFMRRAHGAILETPLELSAPDAAMAGLG